MIGVGGSVTQEAVRQRAAAGGAPDTTKPGRISDLALLSVGPDDCILTTNNMPGDNGFTGGPVASVEIRGRIDFAITTEAHWTAAEWTSGVLTGGGYSHPGTYVEFFADPGGGHIWHFVVRCRDAAGNLGDISNDVAVDMSF